ncbi:hypothetical protein QVD17_04253 [Tagetes erecta]|uniref:Secreted protein n=1 Tax=Tagetes erecta TaxID=13708 RepID=A0AAD8LCU0_TARER|nr:hypothetical protein QVD17_04253 [Tagetes erecta]
MIPLSLRGIFWWFWTAIAHQTKIYSICAEYVIGESCPHFCFTVVLRSSIHTQWDWELTNNFTLDGFFSLIFRFIFDQWICQISTKRWVM